MNCKNCGSQNHSSYDCSKPYNGWNEREPVSELKPASVVAKQTTDREESLSRKSAIESTITKRKGFPFLRESTRMEMNERIARMTAPKTDMVSQSPNQCSRAESGKPDCSPPPMLKKKKKTISTKQESLF